MRAPSRPLIPKGQPLRSQQNKKLIEKFRKLHTISRVDGSMTILVLIVKLKTVKITAITNNLKYSMRQNKHQY